MTNPPRRKLIVKKTKTKTNLASEKLIVRRRRRKTNNSKELGVSSSGVAQTVHAHPHTHHPPGFSLYSVGKWCPQRNLR